MNEFRRGCGKKWPNRRREKTAEGHSVFVFSSLSRLSLVSAQSVHKLTRRWRKDTCGHSRSAHTRYNFCNKHHLNFLRRVETAQLQREAVIARPHFAQEKKLNLKESRQILFSLGRQEWGKYGLRRRAAFRLQFITIGRKEEGKKEEGGRAMHLCHTE